MSVGNGSNGGLGLLLAIKSIEVLESDKDWVTSVSTPVLELARAVPFSGGVASSVEDIVSFTKII